MKKSKRLKTQRQKLILYTVLTVSLTANIAFFASTVYLRNSSSLDNAIINQANQLMCSDDYREKVQSQGNRETLALLDYTCIQNGSRKFYNDGFQSYRKHLGYPVETTQ